jgi:hypothetical protein
MGLLSSAEIKGAERLQCLDYYEAEIGVTAFQAREADIFNDVLATYHDAIKKSPAAARQVSTAAQRLVQAAEEIIRRRDAIQPVPELAFALHWAWHVTSVAYAAWARATLTAMETLANGQTPLYKYVRHLATEHETAWHKAQKEEKKFLKLLRFPPNEIVRITNNRIEEAEMDSWQPKQSLNPNDEKIISETTVHVCS